MLLQYEIRVSGREPLCGEEALKTGENRLGYTVSVKLGHAVVRNRVRRRLREVVRLNAPRMKTGWDIVLVARSRCIGAPWRKLEAAFLGSCEKLGLLEEGSAE